ncbi:MAG: replication restart DNA helicase PriA [Gloeocapsa sp. DLM2.Bin57]|nr:MAG: replication restart DNA helicase PriA [Gloeocapsa sp. DLM2.Bin57]
MTKTQVIIEVCCPNCGAQAQKTILDNKIVQTSCPKCDYLLISCLHTGKVVEAYAPGLIFTPHS